MQTEILLEAANFQKRRGWFETDIASDDDTSPPDGFDDILNEVCEEAGYKSDESEDGAW